MLPKIILKSKRKLEDKKSGKADKNGVDHEMMGIEDEAVAVQNSQNRMGTSGGLARMNIFSEDEWQHAIGEGDQPIMSKITSASSSKKNSDKLVAGSLSTVLCQSLIADDQETISWILQ